MKVIHLNSFEQILEFGVYWDELLDGGKDDHVFMTMEWLTTWWKHYSDNRKLLLLIVEDEKRVLAVAPLMETTYKLFGLKLQMIEFVGTPHSDYHAFICLEKSLVCLRMLMSYVRECLTTWDCIELKDIPENTETARILKLISGEPMELEERKLDLCPSIPLPQTFEEYFRKLGKTTRKRLRQGKRKLGSNHKVEFRRYDEIGSVEESMKTFFDLHQKRFQSKGAPGLFVDETFRNFHLEVAKRFAEKGWLRLYFLTVDDEAVSAVYAFLYKSKLYYYLSGFDPKYSKYGVGNLTTKNLVRIGIEEGLKELDFMRGGHLYKTHWNTVIRRNIELSTIRCNPVAKAYEWFVRSNTMPSLSDWLRKRALSNKT